MRGRIFGSLKRGSLFSELVNLRASATIARRLTCDIDVRLRAAAWFRRGRGPAPEPQTSDLRPMPPRGSFPGVSPHIGIPAAFVHFDDVEIGQDGAVIGEGVF